MPGQRKTRPARGRNAKKAGGKKAPVAAPPRKKVAPAGATKSRRSAQTRGAEASSDAQLGQKIRDLRRAKGMTLEVLADAIGKSVGFLSQIERGKSSLTIGDLQRISQALEVQVTWFLEPAEAQPAAEQGIIVRRASRRSIDFPGADIHDELLSPDLSGHFEVFEATYGPHAEAPGNAAREWGGRKKPDVEEFGVILSGQLELWVDDVYFLLKEGDSFTIRGDQIHRSRNPTDAPTVLVWVLSPPIF